VRDVLSLYEEVPYGTPAGHKLLATRFAYNGR
jgi:hypothetical protein